MSDALRQTSAVSAPLGGAVSPAEKLIDFHTHILPEMDDGSSSTEESIRMIRASADAGCACIVLTPHFYADRDEPERFFKRRADRLQRLKQEWTASVPLLVPGAEVAYFEGIAAMENLTQMCIGHSRTLLLEMPFRPWTGRIMAEVMELAGYRGYHVVLAHAERYLRFQSKEAFYRLIDRGVRIQVNAGFFTDWRTRRKALHMLDDGMIHLLGSDCHNMSFRPPNLGDACRIIQDKRGKEAVHEIMARSVRLLRTNEARSKAGSEVIK